MVRFAYLAVSAGVIVTLLLVLLLAAYLGDALLGILVLVVLTAFAGLWGFLDRQPPYPIS